MELVRDILTTTLGLLGIFLMMVFYTYLDRLEKMGCVCAEHPYRKFIKTYTMVAVGFLIFFTLFPVGMLTKMFGETFGFLYSIVLFLYTIGTIVFWIYALIYIRYLMREKCLCSEDVRREVMFGWAILEIVVLSILLCTILFNILKSASIGTAMGKISRAAFKTLPNKVVRSQIDPLRASKDAYKTGKKSLKKIFKK